MRPYAAFQLLLFLHDILLQSSQLGQILYAYIEKKDAICWIWYYTFVDQIVLCRPLYGGVRFGRGEGLGLGGNCESTQSPACLRVISVLHGWL
ncbi:hypothetical protein C8R42DRAFT_314623 [Lentinula raphanica]|nr:hypothetical protein C8R42DRAFT_314623 [Lentinula raphanica]